MKHCYSIATPDVPLSRSVFGLNGDFETNLEKIKQAGFDGVELIMCDPEKVNLEQMVSSLKRHNLEAVMISSGEITAIEGLSLSSPDKEIRTKTIQRFGQLAKTAQLLGTNINIGRSRGMLQKGISKEKTDVWLIDSLKAICDDAGPLGVSYALEPVAPQLMNYINTLEETLVYIDRIGYDNISYMLDTQHMYLGEKDMFGVIRHYGKEALHVHLTDSNRNYPGSGEIPFETVIAAFSQAGYEKAFAHESLPVPDMERCMQYSINHMKPILNKYYTPTPVTY